MKNVKITHFTHAEVDAQKETLGFMKIPLEHKLIRAEGENLEVSDGFHTFDELYDHRIALYIAVFMLLRLHTNAHVWRSKLHCDGTSFEGWFILGIGEKKGEQITYHLPLERWDETAFAITFDHAPEWDGHTPEDVLNRIKNL